MSKRSEQVKMLDEIKSRLVTTLTNHYYKEPKNYHDRKHNEVIDSLIYKVEHINLDGMMMEALK